MYRNNPAVESSATLGVRSQTSHSRHTVDVIKVYQRTRVTCARSNSVQWAGAASRFCAVWMTRQTDTTSIGILGRRTLGNTVRTILYVFACIALISSLKHKSQLVTCSNSLSIQSSKFIHQSNGGSRIVLRGFVLLPQKSHNLFFSRHTLDRCTYPF